MCGLTPLFSIPPPPLASRQVLEDKVVVASSLQLSDRVALEPELGPPSVYYDLSDDLAEQAKQRARAGSGANEMAPMGLMMMKGSKRNGRSLVVLDRLALLLDEYREQLKSYAALRDRMMVKGKAGQDGGTSHAEEARGERDEKVADDGGALEARLAYPGAAAGVALLDATVASIRAKIADLEAQLQHLRPTFEALSKANQQ